MMRPVHITHRENVAVTDKTVLLEFCHPCGGAEQFRLLRPPSVRIIRLVRFNPFQRVKGNPNVATRNATRRNSAAAKRRATADVAGKSGTAARRGRKATTDVALRLTAAQHANLIALLNASLPAMPDAPLDAAALAAITDPAEQVAAITAALSFPASVDRFNRENASTVSLIAAAKDAKPISRAK